MADPRRGSPVVVGRLLVDDDARVADWISKRLPLDVPDGGIGSCRAIGVLDAGGEIVAGVAYSGKRFDNIEMTVASTTPRWCSRDTLQALFWFPFVQLGCARVTATTRRGNKRARAFLERLGFTREGAHPSAGKGGATLISYGLYRANAETLIADGVPARRKRRSE